MKIVQSKQVDYDKLRVLARVDDPTDEGYAKLVFNFAETLANEIEKDLEGSSDNVGVPSTTFNNVLRKINANSLPLEVLGESLVWLSEYWTLGDELVNSLSVVELKVFEQSLIHMLTEQQKAAQDVEKPQKHLA